MCFLCCELTDKQRFFQHFSVSPGSSRKGVTLRIPLSGTDPGPGGPEMGPVIPEELLLFFVEMLYVVLSYSIFVLLAHSFLFLFLVFGIFTSSKNLLHTELD